MQPETNKIISSQPGLNLRGELMNASKPQRTDSGALFSEEFERATQRESSTDAEVRHDSRREAKASQNQRADRQDSAERARTKAQSRRSEAADNRGERTSRRAESSEEATSEHVCPTGHEGPTRQQANRRIQWNEAHPKQIQASAPEPKQAGGPEPQNQGANHQAALPQMLAPAGQTTSGQATQSTQVQGTAPAAGVSASAPQSGTSDQGQLGNRQSAQAQTQATKTDAPVEGPDARDAMEKLLVERENRMDREASILRQIKASMRPGGRELSMRLSPASLGRVDLNIALREGRLTATIRTETTEALEALQRQLPELQAALESQGIEVMSFDLELASEGDRSGSFAAQTGDQNLSAPLTGNTRLATEASVSSPRDLAAELRSSRETQAHNRGGVDAIG